MFITNNNHHVVTTNTTLPNQLQNVGGEEEEETSTIRTSLKQSIKKLQTTLRSSNDQVHDNTTTTDHHQESSLEWPMMISSNTTQKEMCNHLDNIRFIIEKKAGLKNQNININNNSNNNSNVNSGNNNNNSNTTSTTTRSTYYNSVLKKSKQMIKITEICISIFMWVKNEKRLELIRQALSSEGDRSLVLMVEHLDSIMSHVLRQFISRKERKMGKSDSGKKGEIYKKIERDASGGVILDLFVFSLSIGCLDANELFVIEHVSQNMEYKLQQQFWKHNTQRESIASLGGVFLCATIEKNIGPHHMLWNEFMESLRIALRSMDVNEIPGRDRFLRSLYSIQLTYSKNIDQIVDIYKWATVSTVLSCQNSKYLPSEISKYLLDSDSLYQEKDDCKYITSKFIMKELKKLHAIKDRTTAPSPSFHIPSHEIPVDLLYFLDDMVQGKTRHDKNLRKTCSEEVVFLICLLIRFYMLRRRSGMTNAFYRLVQKFDMMQPIFESILEFLVEKENSFKSTYAFSMVRDLLFLISANDGAAKFDPISNEMLKVAEDLVSEGKTCLDTTLDNLKLWVDGFFGILVSHPMSSIYPFILRKCLSLMLCRLSNSSINKYSKSSLLEIVGHYHQLLFPTSCFTKKTSNSDLNRCLITMLRFSAFVLLNVQPRHEDNLTTFYVNAAKLYRDRAQIIACRFAFLDSFYYDTENNTNKVFAIEEDVLLKMGEMMLSSQRTSSLTDLEIVFEEI